VNPGQATVQPGSTAAGRPGGLIQSETWSRPTAAWATCRKRALQGLRGDRLP